MRSSIAVSFSLHVLLLGLCLLPARWREQGAALQSAKAAREPMWIELESPTRKQIVRTEKAQLTKVAPKDALLGERNQKVEKETIAQAKQAGDVKAAPPQHKRNALNELGVAIVNPRAEVEGAQEESRQWANVGSIPQDYVRGVAEGQRTFLNTKEFIFFGYFQRIRERLDRAWVPMLRERITKLYRRGRSLASDMEHTTKVLVVLNKQGEVVRVQLLGESGTRDLDDAAVGAFNEAGPFPNPPKGIVDTNGEIEIPWEFILKT